MRKKVGEAKLSHLCNLQVSVNGLDKAGCTPLHWAAQGGHTGIMAKLSFN